MDEENEEAIANLVRKCLIRYLTLREFLNLH